MLQMSKAQFFDWGSHRQPSQSLRVTSRRSLVVVASMSQHTFRKGWEWERKKNRGKYLNLNFFLPHFVILSRAVSVLAFNATVFVTLIGFGLVYDFVNFLKDLCKTPPKFKCPLNWPMKISRLESSDMTMNQHENESTEMSQKKASRTNIRRSRKTIFRDDVEKHIFNQKKNASKLQTSSQLK